MITPLDSKGNKDASKFTRQNLIQLVQAVPREESELLLRLLNLKKLRVTEYICCHFVFMLANPQDRCWRGSAWELYRSLCRFVGDLSSFEVGWDLRSAVKKGVLLEEPVSGDNKRNIYRLNREVLPCK